MSDTLLRTKASPKWLGKQMIFILAICGFAMWALYDAAIAYPKGGERAADFLKWQYLKAALSPGVLERTSIEDPEEDLQRLIERQKTATLSPVETARMNWLAALRNASRLDPSRTQITDPRGTLEALEQRFSKTTEAPKALSRLDIPVQWGIFFVCSAAALAMIAVLIRTVSTVFRFDPESKTLTLPSGQSIAATDVVVYDKRKWDKFLIFLKVREGAPSLGGQEVRLDLLRHVPLEEWVLEMEKTAFPPTSEPQGEASPSAMLMTQPSVEMPKA
ncbi:MAG: hypothetical protein KF691_00370 [Phycisphaeraceae bacterium]|nr:hypothetical protein [Phycisphaeraceae bacterium]